MGRWERERVLEPSDFGGRVGFAEMEGRSVAGERGGVDGCEAYAAGTPAPCPGRSGICGILTVGLKGKRDDAVCIKDTCMCPFVCVFVTGKYKERVDG